MYKTIFIIIFFIFENYNLFFSQVTQNWVTNYNGPGNGVDEACSIKVDALGNVYVTGESAGNGTLIDYATIKYNSSGVQQWVQRYNGPGNGADRSHSLTLDGSGNIYITGADVGNGTICDYATIKYNSSGVQQWVARYNGPANSSDEGYSIVTDISGNVYVTGASIGSGTEYDYATIKYNSSGVQQWVQIYNGPGNGDDGAYSIVVDNAGNVYVSGGSEGNGSNYDIATIKYNSSGVQQWIQRYNGPANSFDISASMGIDQSGNIYVSGSSIGVGSAISDYITIKYNSSGIQQWVTRYNSPGNGDDNVYSMVVDNTGNVYVTGTCGTSGPGCNYTTIKYNTSGGQQWLQIYNGQGNNSDYGRSIIVDETGNVYVTGTSTGNGTAKDYATIKYNSSGVQQWIQIYNGSGNGEDGASSIAVDGIGNVYVTGASYVTGSEYNYTTIKYSQTVSIQTMSNKIPDKFLLYQNYPNPFNPSTTINFSLPEALEVILTVYNASGQLISQLVNKKLTAGFYNYVFEANNLPNGVYFYRLETHKFIDAKKMILLK